MRRIPIHVEPSSDTPAEENERSASEKAGSAVETEASEAAAGRKDVGPSAEDASPEQGPPVEDEIALTETAEDESIDVWRDRALRLQAEIENYRKRQRRLAEEEIASERQRLLNAFAYVADDLRRALDAGESDAKGLRQGVALTYRNLVRLLNREGVQPIEAQGERFNPALHEAVATVPHAEAGVQPQTVIEVTERGYLLGDRLLRPARVVVAV
jgi:molecular chaperone GrpE